MQKLQKSLKHKNQSNKTFYEFARLFFTFNKKCLKEKFDWKISKQNKFNFYFLNLKQKSVNHSFFSFIDPITNRWFVVKSLTNISLENLSLIFYNKPNLLMNVKITNCDDKIINSIKFESIDNVFICACTKSRK